MKKQQPHSVNKTLRDKRLREQRVFLDALRTLRWRYFSDYIEYLERRSLDATDFSFYEFLVLVAN